LRNSALQNWTAYIAETAALLGAALSVMNPAAYNVETKYIKEIAGCPSNIEKRESLAEILRQWTTPYTASSLINNRDTPLHRDNGGSYTAMDLLATVGAYRNGN